MSAAGVERVVQIGGMSYVDPDGLHQFALGGATVRVHPDDVERFDSLNVAAGSEPEESPPEPSPKRRSTRRTAEKGDD